jgi:hypothetical protein
MTTLAKAMPQPGAMDARENLIAKRVVVRLRSGTARRRGYPRREDDGSGGDEHGRTGPRT